MSKVIMGNDDFNGCLSEPQVVSAWWKESAQIRVFFLSRSLLLNHLELEHSKAKLLQTSQHCRVSFYIFVGQPLSKQLFIKQERHKDRV